MNIVSAVHEGFQNAPKLYGSDVREPGKVTDFESGMKEAGKGFFYGYYDGITGLVREPMEGAKKGGFLGAIKGAGRSFINVNMRPAAGALGLVVHPTQGAWKSMQKMWAKEQEQHQRETRLSDGVGEVQSSTKLDRDAILKKFETAKVTTKVRQEKYKDIAEKEMYGSKDQDGKTDRDTIGTETSQASTSSAPSDTTALTSPPAQSMEDEDALFERDILLAKELSIAEQRGYERGLAASRAAIQ